MALKYEYLEPFSHKKSPLRRPFFQTPRTLNMLDVLLGLSVSFNYDVPLIP